MHDDDQLLVENTILVKTPHDVFQGYFRVCFDFNKLPTNQHTRTFVYRCERQPDPEPSYLFTSLEPALAKHDDEAFYVLAWVLGKSVELLETNNRHYPKFVEPEAMEHFRQELLSGGDLTADLAELGFRVVVPLFLNNDQSRKAASQLFSIGIDPP